MSFFDFFFPEQAQASHLRTIANNTDRSEREFLSEHRERMNQLKEKRLESSRTKSQEQRIDQLERELGQAGLTIEALIQLLENAKVITREELGKTIQELDASDGVIDGKITPPQQQPFQPNRTWPDGTAER